MLLFVLQKLDCEEFESETGCEYIQDASEYDLVFVLSAFEGEVFEKLHKADVRIVGPPVIIKCARDDIVSHSNTTDSLLPKKDLSVIWNMSSK